MIIVSKEVIEEDELMEVALDNGAEDMKTEEEDYMVTTTVEDFDNVVQAVKARNIETVSAEIAKIPSTYVKLEGKQAQQMLKLMEKLEELDDVQDVWANFDISDAEIEEYQKNN